MQISIQPAFVHTIADSQTLSLSSPPFVITDALGAWRNLGAEKRRYVVVHVGNDERESLDGVAPSREYGLAPPRIRL